MNRHNYCKIYERICQIKGVDFEKKEPDFFRFFSIFAYYNHNFAVKIY